MVQIQYHRNHPQLGALLPLLQPGVVDLAQIIRLLRLLTQFRYRAPLPALQNPGKLPPHRRQSSGPLAGLLGPNR
jgi:hypothetical protein